MQNGISRTLAVKNILDGLVRVLLVIFTIVFYTFSKKRHTYRAIWAKVLFHNDFHKNDKCKKCKGLYTFM